MKSDRKSAKAGKRSGLKKASKKSVKADENGSVGHVVRHSYTMPEDEYTIIERIRAVCLKRMIVVNKSEVLRGGVRLLDQLSDREIVRLMQSLPKVKAGRRRIE